MQPQALQFLLPVDASEINPFYKHVSGLLLLASGELLVPFARVPGGYAATLSLPKKPADVSLLARGELLARFSCGPSGCKQQFSAPLTVFETREIGRYPRPGLPYPRTPVRFSAITDLHTHSSGQVSARGLIEVALASHEEFCYPARLLDEAGISYDKAHKKPIERIFFAPEVHLHPYKKGEKEPGVPLSTLSAEALTKLESCMVFPTDGQRTYGYMEVPVYKYRTPFSKSRALFIPTLERTAEEYEAMGIRYAELTMTGTAFDASFIALLHEHMPGIEQNTGVTMRFLAGLPRNLPNEKLLDYVAQLKYLAASPYLVGVDVVGYETNKTVDIAEPLEDIARWAAQHQPGFVLRVHAGENPKNPENILQALQIAERYGLFCRIGHALYGYDDTTRSLAIQMAQAGTLIVEVNPDSNLANNNLDKATDLTRRTRWFFEHGIPVVLATDGAGIYLTTPQQTALVASFAGFTEEDFASVAATEAAYIKRMQPVLIAKEKALTRQFLQDVPGIEPLYTPDVEIRYAAEKAVSLQGLHALLDARGIVHDIKQVQRDIEGRVPVLVGGASGSSWKRIEPKDQREAVLAMQMLVRCLNPQKAYVITGRSKKQGIGRELDHALRAYRRDNPAAEKFIFLGMLAEAFRDSEATGLNDFTHMQLVPGTFVNLGTDKVRFLKERGGVALFFGGSAFTYDFITNCHNEGVPFGLMHGPRGAAHNKAQVLDAQHVFSNAVEMVEVLVRTHNALLLPHITPQFVRKTYEELRA